MYSLLCCYHGIAPKQIGEGIVQAVMVPSRHSGVSEKLERIVNYRLGLLGCRCFLNVAW